MTAGGTAEVLLTGADDYTAAQEGMTLAAGDKIRTGSGGSIELSFNEANSNVVRVAGNTEATVTLCADEKMEMSSGEVFASVSDLPGGSSFEIRTPTAVSGARGTDWVTTVSDEGTDVEAVDSVPYVKHFESNGEKSARMTLIQPGQMTTVQRFRQPSQPRPMAPGRRQQWQSMKQQVRQRAGEAIGKRQQRPQFNRQDFIKQMKENKGRRKDQGQGQSATQDQGDLKPLVSGPKKLDRIVQQQSMHQQDATVSAVGDQQPGQLHQQRVLKQQTVQQAQTQSLQQVQTQHLQQAPKTGPAVKKQILRTNQVTPKTSQKK